MATTVIVLPPSGPPAGREPRVTLTSQRGDVVNSTDELGEIALSTQEGRKGLAYDWQTIFAAAQAAALDHELAALTPEFAE